MKLAYALLLTLAPAVAWGGDWPQFRGPEGRGYSAETDLPTAFSPTENVAWKVELPGPGPASPIVVGGRVIVTAASGPRQNRLHVVALDAASGQPRWQRALWPTGPGGFNSFGGIAASTPASDGRRIFALFSTNDLACFDLDGRLLWLRALALESPHTRNDVGMASSPLVAGDTLVVQLESPGEAFAIGLDAADGATRWRLPLESNSSWTTPTLLRGPTPAEDLVVLQNRPGLVALHPRDGREAWKYPAGVSTISSSAAWGPYLFAPIGGLSALRWTATGVEEVWRENRLRVENVCPVVHEGRIYALKSPGILVCGEAETGKMLWQLRLEGPFWATPALGNNHLYTVNHKGLVQIVRLGDREGTLVASGQIDPDVTASPAIADGAVYFRTKTHLWKVE